MVDDMTVVSCPCCNGELYRVRHFADATWTKPDSSPRFQKDIRGPFMVCAHCAKRIDFLVLESDSKARHIFQMAPRQACK